MMYIEPFLLDFLLVSKSKSMCHGVMSISQSDLDPSSDSGDSSDFVPCSADASHVVGFEL